MYIPKIFTFEPSHLVHIIRVCIIESLLPKAQREVKVGRVVEDSPSGTMSI